eukprot:1373783-Amorphochlora_amoeboformis.AAC.1
MRPQKQFQGRIFKVRTYYPQTGEPKELILTERAHGIEEGVEVQRDMCVEERGACLGVRRYTL